MGPEDTYQKDQTDLVIGTLNESNDLIIIEEILLA
jgi:hypothetical protein